MQKKTSSSGASARKSHVQSPQFRDMRRKYEPDSQPIALLTILSLLLPPAGLLLTWRSNRLTNQQRGIFSVVALISMTFIFCLMMPKNTAANIIRPVPVTPSQAGYGAVSDAGMAVMPQPTDSVPAAPDAVAPQAANTPVEEPDSEPGELTPDTTVFAVTNNATSYHLYEICETQANNRAMTLQQALDEGLTPCEKCVGAVG